MDANSLIVSISGVKKKFGPNVVLNDLSLQLKSGKFYALLGKNGSGKSTLMRVLMRHEQINAGGRTVLGISTDEDSGEFYQDVGFVSESVLYSIAPLNQVFAYFPKIYKKWDQKLFESLIKSLEIDLSKHHSQLSRGQKMRVVFAAAAAIKPKLFLIDEITSVLDAYARTFVMNYLTDFTQSGGTVLMATNIVSEIHGHADELILLDRGRVKLQGSIQEIGRQFWRIRKEHDQTHPIFDLNSCIEIGFNSDRSVSYLVSAEEAMKGNLPASFIERKEVTAEEAFIYLTHFEEKVALI